MRFAPVRAVVTRVTRTVKCAAGGTIERYVSLSAGPALRESSRATACSIDRSMRQNEWSFSLS